MNQPHPQKRLLESQFSSSSSGVRHRVPFFLFAWCARAQSGKTKKKKTVAMEQDTLDTEGGAELGAVAQLALGDTKALVRLDADFDGAAELVGLSREVRGAALDEVDEAKGNSLSLLD